MPIRNSHHRILITGAAGFIGKRVVPKLLERGHEVHTVHPDNTYQAAGGESVHTADLLNAANARTLVNEVRPTHLLHLAWGIPPQTFWYAPENTAWLSASTQLFRDFANAGGKRWVATGSCAEYDWRSGGRYRESDRCDPATLYGACKASMHMVVGRMAEHSGIEAVTGRVFFPYGSGEPSGRLVPSIVRALRAGESAACTEGLQVRDYIYVEDVADALVVLVESNLTGAVNIGSGIPTTIREIASKIGEILGRPDLLRFGAVPTRAGDPAEIVADITRLQTTGWKPNFSLDAGLRRTIGVSATSAD